MSDSMDYKSWFGNVDRGPLWAKCSQTEIVKIYDNWAANDYDKILYKSPKIAAETVASLYSESHRREINILDVGAGTGLVGAVLHQLGFHNIDAVDPSPGMLKTAEEKKVYRRLICDFIKTNTLEYLNGYYDCLTAAGCVIPGHLEAENLYDFIRLVKKGGHIVITMRGEWPDVPDFFKDILSTISKMEESRKIQIIAKNEIKNYSQIIPDSMGHKFVFKVL